MSNATAVIPAMIKSCTDVTSANGSRSSSSIRTSSVRLSVLSLVYALHQIKSMWIIRMSINDELCVRQHRHGNCSNPPSGVIRTISTFFSRTNDHSSARPFEKSKAHKTPQFRIQLNNLGNLCSPDLRDSLLVVRVTSGRYLRVHLSYNCTAVLMAYYHFY